MAMAMGDYGWSMNFSKSMAMGDYGWSMDSDTPQGIVAVEYGRVLEYPKKRKKTSDHEKKQYNSMALGS